MQPLPGAHHKTDTPWHLTICNGAAILVSSHKKWQASSWMAIKVVFCLVGYAWNDHDHGCRDRYYIALTILILMIRMMMRIMRIKITIRDKVEDVKIWLHLHGGPSKEKRNTLSV